MKYLIFFLCMFLFVSVKAQAIDSVEEKNLVSLYADNSFNISYQSMDSVKSHFILIKIYPELTESFTAYYAGFIKRQISSNWFIADKSLVKILPENFYAGRVYAANNNWKLSPSLLKSLQKLNEEKDFVFLVQVKEPADFKVTVGHNASSAVILSGFSNINLFRLKTTAVFIKQILLPDDNVISIDLKASLPKEETVINDYDNSENGINLFLSKYPFINGKDLTVSIKENMFDTSDIDFKGRYKSTRLESASNTSHAANMATLIGGGGNSFYTGKGIAWGCNLSSSDFANLLPDNDSVYRQYNISVQNHSYGVGVENFYGSDAAAYDASLISNPELVDVFSAGNAGNLTPADGQYKDLTGFANLTGSFKMAKNILTVGSVDSFYNVPLLSSKGPAYDGRIKPDLVAYGNDGSSGAAAITSGTALVLQSAYAQLHDGKLPPNALVKAVLINSADDINTKGPDYYSGFGNVNTYRGVKDMLSQSFFMDSLKQSETKNFTLQIPAQTKNLKITLVWNDPPAQANAYTALVNDLDLQLQQTSNNFTWLPWVLNAYPNADSLLQLPLRKRDSLNVVEQITLDTPTAGTYIIHVNGYHLASSAQSFCIAYSCDTLNTFQFISPARAQHFTSGALNIFRWQNNYSIQNGKLEYSIDKGSTWQLINANVDLSKKYYQWLTPDTFSLALARMTIGSDVFVSDTFNFSKPLNPKVGFVCDDSVLIYWNKVKGIDSYSVYRLGSLYLEEYKVTTDTSFTFPANSGSKFFAVNTAFNNSDSGVNSYTFNYSTQATGCYISNFLADIQNNNSALLKLELGTFFNIASIEFQQLTANGWITISTIAPVASTSFTYNDASLFNGINTFRAAVMLANGRTIYSTQQDVYYFKNNIFILLPNPVHRGAKFTVLSNNFLKNKLLLFDVTGRKVLQQTITDQRTDISVSNLSKGVYFVVIYSENEKLFSGKLVIL